MKQLTWYNFVIAIIIAFPCLLINTVSKSKWFCNFYGWHKSPIEQSFDGCSNSGRCPRCNKPVLQDSNGDWF